MTSRFSRTKDSLFFSDYYYYLSSLDTVEKCGRHSIKSPLQRRSSRSDKRINVFIVFQIPARKGKRSRAKQKTPRPCRRGINSDSKHVGVDVEVIRIH